MARVREMRGRISTSHALWVAYFVLVSSLLGCAPTDSIKEIESSSNVTNDSRPESRLNRDEAVPASGESTTKSRSEAATDATESDRIAPDKSDGDQEVQGWPLFRGDSRSTGVARSVLPNKLDVLWKKRVESEFESTPVVVAHNGRKLAIIGDVDGKLCAFDLENGDEVWKFETTIGFLAAPAYSGGRVFIGDLDGVFHCLDLEAGEVWTFPTESNLESSANLHGELVVFGTESGRLYGLRQDTGELAWQFEMTDPILCGITIHDGRAFVAGCDGALHVINLENGNEERSIVIESPTKVTPAARDEMIFVGTEQAGFFAVDWRRGEVKWSFNDDQQSLAMRSCPAIFGDHVVFGSQSRNVYSLNPVSGKVNWKTTLKADVDSSPIISGDHVFVGTTRGHFHCLELSSGKTTWEMQLDGGLVGSPAVAFDRLVIATDRGAVYCLGKNE
jgi:outer membrane protein assembly factor BamB